MKKNNLYFKASKIANKNALNLCQESKLMIDNDYLARGFALGVLSIEESAKSFLYRCVSVDMLTEKKLKQIVVDHEKKLYQSGLILTLAFFIMDHLIKLAEIIERDKQKNEPNYSTFPSELTKHGLEAAKKAVDILRNAHKIKLDSLYVDVRDNKIVNPEEIIDKKKASQILFGAEITIDIIKSFIELDDVKIYEFLKTELASLLKEEGYQEFKQYRKSLF